MNNVKRPFPFYQEEGSTKKLKADLVKGSHPGNNKNPIMSKRKSDRQTSNFRLIEKIKPNNFENYVGQEHLIGDGSVLNCLLRKGQILSMILWGPPGCGKASLADIITLISKDIFKDDINIIKLSASSCGIKNIKDAVKTAKESLTFGWKTIVVMKEIHRFNKLQQDIFLPHVEQGTFILIGTTTENPSYSLNPALLSRCRIFELNKLSSNDIMKILVKAIELLEGKICYPEKSNRKSTADHTMCDDEEKEMIKFSIEEKSLEWLAEVCNGDASVALDCLELAVETIQMKCNALDNQCLVIELSSVKSALLNSMVFDNKQTSLVHHMYSALSKSIRANKENASLYWLARIMAMKEDPVYIARRLVRISCEDVGLADPDALSIAVRTMDGCQMIGMPECDILLGQCVVYLARAPKSRLVFDALQAAKKLVDANLQRSSERTSIREFVTPNFFR